MKVFLWPAPANGEGGAGGAGGDDGGFFSGCYSMAAAAWLSLLSLLPI